MRFRHSIRVHLPEVIAGQARVGKIAILLLAVIAASLSLSRTRAVELSREDRSPAAARAIFEEYCLACHTGPKAKGGVNFEKLNAEGAIAERFQDWQRVADALENKTMPPKAMPQPSDAERAQALGWIRNELSDYAKKHDGDPGRVTVRRLTSGEYAYSIKDLTGVDLKLGIDPTSDSVGGEGFTNFGDVQFMQDANLERYLAAAKLVADHAVIGAGPLEFFTDPGKTGFELSAIDRIRDIYAANGIRTVSGEGGRPFGLEKYGKSMYVAWRYQHRAALGEPNITLKDLSAREGITLRLAEHIWEVVNLSTLQYPTNEVVDRWRKLPAPGADAKASDEAARKGCDEIQKYMVTWPSWLFARGDVAAGGAGDESPLEFSDRTLNVKSTHRFIFVRGGRGPALPPGPAKIYLNTQIVNPKPGEKPTIIWRNLTVAFRKIEPRKQVKAGESVVLTTAEMEAVANLRRGILPPGPRETLRSLVTAETAQQLNFGKGPNGLQIGPDDFVTEGSTMFEVPMPEGPYAMNLQVDAVLGENRDQVLRILISDRPDGSRGQPTRALVGDMSSAGYKAFRSGVMQYVTLMPPNSHGEPTPADKDPVPDPFDNTYNVPEHDEFVQKVKYLRDDRFLAENLIDGATRTRLNNAWKDLYAGFEYHDNYLRLLAKHYNIDLKGKGIVAMDAAAIASLPEEMRKYVGPLRAEYMAAIEAQKAAQPGHLEDCLAFAARAWRRPLSETEGRSLRAFYKKTLALEPDHRKAIRATLARILVAPQFLYRVEPAGELRIARPASYNGETPIEGTNGVGVRPLTSWEMAGRLSYFLWASIPDDELRRAANANELTRSEGIQRQVRRMLADAKARRLSTEFFGQWLGFYHFDDYKGVDSGRFPEFTEAVKDAMNDEAVSFFEYIIRRDRPVREVLFADYTFLNRDLAKFYGVKKEIKATDKGELVEGANAFNRGGMLRLGAVLTSTSAPLRTSPVKRGDWILRRVLGTPTPPPPPDAGSIPADDKMFGGLSLKAKLEQHKRNATCASCHTRIDPLGFSLEHYDPTGRWRDQYPDGKAIEDSAALTDKTEIAGVNGLLDYLRGKEPQVRKTLSYKMVGYALGRTVQASDLALIDRMVQAGGEAEFSKLVLEIALSKQFRTRLGRQEAPATVKIASVTTKSISHQNWQQNRRTGQ
jgi:mono/diheme cytochrome c family protein